MNYDHTQILPVRTLVSPRHLVNFRGLNARNADYRAGNVLQKCKRIPQSARYEVTAEYEYIS